MKDKHDSKTIDPFLKPARGRPKTGSALTSTERSRLKRQADREAILASSLDRDYSQISTSALLEAFANAVRSKYETEAKALSKELLKRSKI